MIVKKTPVWLITVIITSSIAFMSWLTTTAISAQTDSSVASAKVDDVDKRLDRIESKLDGIMTSFRSNPTY